MSSFLDSASVELLQKKLDAVWMRQQVIAGNIANAATPGYKSKTVAFEAQLQRQLNATGSSDRSIQNALDRVQPTIVRQEGTEAREDGNNVDEDKESVEMARALIEYNYLCNALSSQINRMRFVITEGRG
jgi:flagellar basal-body rod protein FlgB